MIIRDSQCDTCIYRPDSYQNLAALENECRDPRAPYHFVRWRACHSDPTEQTACAGFVERHGADCTPVQIHIRLQAAAGIAGGAS